MSYAINGSTTVPVKAMVTKGGNPVPTATTAIEVPLKTLLAQVFAAIPNQAAGTATVGAIVTALQTLP